MISTTHDAAGPDMKVFVVEDSPAVRERLLELVGEVEDTEIVGEASTFDQAVAGITRTRPDVAILDIKLADDRGTGIDVLNQVRPVLPAMKTIVMSNFATPQHMKASADAGADYFLDKTAEFDRIAGILIELQGAGRAR
jgi:DNA-binding NarL/FixJ family response regulator